jgi:hypothetical protein
MFLPRLSRLNMAQSSPAALSIISESWLAVTVVRGPLWAVSLSLINKY